MGSTACCMLGNGNGMSECQKQPSRQQPTTHKKTQDTRRQASRKGNKVERRYREREVWVGFRRLGGGGGGERMEDGWMEGRERLEARRQSQSQARLPASAKCVVYVSACCRLVAG